MPYVGFRPIIDPGVKRARKGTKKTRGQAVEVIPVTSMQYRIENPEADYRANGSTMVPDGYPGNPVPARVRKVGRTTERTLVVYYLCPWPEDGRPWPDLIPPQKENP